jgi:hypothetical protein
MEFTPFIRRLKACCPAAYMVLDLFCPKTASPRRHEGHRERHFIRIPEPPARREGNSDKEYTLCQYNGYYYLPCPDSFYWEKNFNQLAIIIWQFQSIYGRIFA